jgi:RNA polymerase sigma-70 factor (TIGR02943 family)
MPKREDQDLVASWLQDHGDYLYRFVLSRLSGDTELARDMVQETLLAAWKGREGFGGRSAVRTWLVGILKHKITDHIRLQIRNRQLHEDIETDPTSDWFGADGHWQEAPKAWRANPESLFEDTDFQRVLQRCLDALPALQRDVFVLRELSGEDSGAICKACEITATHLHVLMHRARMALRSCLDLNWFGRKA